MEDIIEEIVNYLLAVFRQQTISPNKLLFYDLLQIVFYVQWAGHSPWDTTSYVFRPGANCALIGSFTTCEPPLGGGGFVPQRGENMSYLYTPVVILWRIEFMFNSHRLVLKHRFLERTLDKMYKSFVLLFHDFILYYFAYIVYQSGSVGVFLYMKVLKLV